MLREPTAGLPIAGQLGLEIQKPRTSHIRHVPGPDPPNRNDAWVCSVNHAVRGRSSMALPVKTTIEDVEKVVTYLKTKPTGATVADAKATVGSKHLDPRKVKAFEFWGIVKVDGDTLTLTEDGRLMGREPDRAAEVYRRAIDRSRPYRAALEWAFHQGFTQLDLNDTAAHWHAHQSDALGTSNETVSRIRSPASSTSLTAPGWASTSLVGEDRRLVWN